MNDEYYRDSNNYSTEADIVKSSYSSERNEIPTIDKTIPSTNTESEKNKYSVNKARRVKIRARISND